MATGAERPKKSVEKTKTKAKAEIKLQSSPLEKKYGGAKYDFSLETALYASSPPRVSSRTRRESRLMPFMSKRTEGGNKKDWALKNCRGNPSRPERACNIGISE